MFQATRWNSQTENMNCETILLANDDTGSLLGLRRRSTFKKLVVETCAERHIVMQFRVMINNALLALESLEIRNVTFDIFCTCYA